MIREQQREVSKVLLDGLYDPDSPISKLFGIRTEVMGEIIWKKMLVSDWQIYPPSCPPKSRPCQQIRGASRSKYDCRLLCTHKFGFGGGKVGETCVHIVEYIVYKISLTKLEEAFLAALALAALYDTVSG